MLFNLPEFVIFLEVGLLLRTVQNSNAANAFAPWKKQSVLSYFCPRAANAQLLVGGLA